MEKKQSGDKRREDSYVVASRLIFLLELLKKTGPKTPINVEAAARELNRWLKKNESNNPTDDKSAAEKKKPERSAVNIRSVQRYLKILVEKHDIQQTTKGNQSMYWFKRSVRNDLAQLSRESALLIGLSQIHLRHLLPSKELELLSPIFNQARKAIESDSDGKKYDRLLKRMIFYPRGFQLFPPKLKDETILDGLMSALCETQQVKILYKGRKDKEARWRTIEPLGLIERSEVFYVVGRDIYAGDNIRNWVLHRMQGIKVLEKFAYPEDFSLKKHVTGVGLNKIHREKPVEVLLRFTHDAGAHLLEGESKIAPQHEVVEMDNEFVTIKCLVKDTEEFRWWLLEKGSGCEILEPAYLRHWIRDELQKALAKYSSDSRS